MLADEDLSENLVLQRIGVLKFVNQGDAPVLRYCLSQRVCLRVVGQGVVNIQQQIVETAFAFGFFLFAQTGIKMVEQVEMEQGKRIFFGSHNGSRICAEIRQYLQIGKGGSVGRIAFFDFGL